MLFTLMLEFYTGVCALQVAQALGGLQRLGGLLGAARSHGGAALDRLRTLGDGDARRGAEVSVRAWLGLCCRSVAGCFEQVFHRFPGC